MAELVVIALLAVSSFASGDLVDNTIHGECDALSSGGTMLYALSQSLWATDRLQSRPWIHRTADNPLRVPGGYEFWEGNAAIAGRPDIFPAYVDGVLLIKRRALECLPAEYSIPLVAAFAAKHAYDVYNNNVVRDRYLGEGPILAAVGWSWAF